MSEKSKGDAIIGGSDMSESDGININILNEQQFNENAERIDSPILMRPDKRVVEPMAIGADIFWSGDRAPVGTVWVNLQPVGQMTLKYSWKRLDEKGGGPSVVAYSRKGLCPAVDACRLMMIMTATHN
ncbi:jg20365 [Pararge aegeria aegeria]|uniref:Jg20365 protein n=1 Tax=Pararge aegeria aegeria TaxID=348720 RepID=A0A8S4R973_9NEOP|nr:jg20365 [Pararge aegeria aegeria]